MQEGNRGWSWIITIPPSVRVREVSAKAVSLQGQKCYGKYSELFQQGYFPLPPQELLGDFSRHLTVWTYRDAYSKAHEMWGPRGLKPQDLSTCSFWHLSKVVFKSCCQFAALAAPAPNKLTSAMFLFFL